MLYGIRLHGPWPGAASASSFIPHESLGCTLTALLGFAIHVTSPLIFLKPTYILAGLERDAHLEQMKHPSFPRKN